MERARAWAGFGIWTLFAVIVPLATYGITHGFAIAFGRNLRFPDLLADGELFLLAGLLCAAVVQDCLVAALFVPRTKAPRGIWLVHLSMVFFVLMALQLIAYGVLLGHRVTPRPDPVLAAEVGAVAAWTYGITFVATIATRLSLIRKGLM